MKKEEIKNNTKKDEIKLRRAEVEKMHIFGFNSFEIANKLGVDVRTVGRDIQENRRERLEMLNDGDAKEWLRNQLSDYIAFVEEMKKTLYEQSQNAETDITRIKALHLAFQIESQKMETIRSILLSLDEFRIFNIN